MSDLPQQQQQQQTPMSSKLTSILILLREDPLNESATITAETAEVPAAQDNLIDGDNEDIILGGDMCNCRKSKCLKLYCQCFNAARVCNEMCRCVNCSNTDSNENGRSEAVKIILDRNPAAFDSKFLSRDMQAQQRAHKSGCKCRKSMCLKKYCECFEASLPCSSTCICVDCHNTSSDASLPVIRRGEAKEPIAMSALPAKASRSTRVAGKAKSRRASKEDADTKPFPLLEEVLPAATSSSKAETAEERSTVVIVGAEPSIPSSSKKRSVIDESDPVLGLLLGTASEEKPLKGERQAKQQPSLSKKRSIGPLPSSSSHPAASSDPLDPAHMVRPTMLSRVVAYKRQRSNSKDGTKSDATLSADEGGNDKAPEDPPVMVPVRAAITTADFRRFATCSAIIPAGKGEAIEEPVPFLSPEGVAAPAASQAGRAGASTAEFRRFASPNTASVASALSLLSRLPVYQEEQ